MDEKEPDWMNHSAVRNSLRTSLARVAWHGYAAMAPIFGLVWPGGADAYLEDKRRPLREDPFGGSEDEPPTP